MRFRILGPLEADDGTAAAPLAAGKQRALLALLLLHANTAVARDRLIDGLWGESVPETAVKMIQIHVSQLRRALPGARLRTRPPGYLLEVGEDELDLQVFERLAGDGRRALAGGDAAGAADTLREALALWRGPALAEFSEPFAGPERARLEELRLAAVEDRLDADLALGRHRELVGELEALAAESPLRERLRGQLVLALYRSGRQAEALAAYRSFRRTLDEELGIAPSAELRELERGILRQDPGLEPAALRAPRPAPGPEPSEIRHVSSGGVSIAYQVVGDGPLDLVLVHGWVCTFHAAWENPRIASFYRRLAALGRLILFDKRGTGMSDRVRGIAPLEERMDDVRAVLDAVGSDRAALLGISEGGPMVALFSATYPQRTVALVAMGTFARRMWAPDYPIGMREGELAWRTPTPAEWGLPIAREFVAERAPSVQGDEEAVRWYASYFVRGASPGAAAELSLMNRTIDVRPVLATIRVPTLVLYRAGEYLRHSTRYMGERIPGARIVELPGDDHLPWEGDQEPLLGEIERFLAGVQAEADFDRVLVTVLFTDTAGSSGPDGLGDAARAELLERHHAGVRANLARHRGREVDADGSGVLAVFDGPARAIRCASAIVREGRSLGLGVRAGLHTGEVELAGDRVRGVAVEIGARVAAAAAPGEVLVSRTVRDLVAGSGLEFDERGPHELEGIPGEWELLAVRAATAGG